MKNTISSDLIEPEFESMKNAFINWFNNRISDADCPKISRREVYVVWFCHVVGNAKMLISTTRPDHMYYEVTYHEEKNQLHIDAYKKFIHESIDIVEKNSDNSEDNLCEAFNDVVSSMFASIF